jgi:general secretion pathway protein G
MNKTQASRRRRPAFTLMEVLLVLAILVILGGTVGIYFAKVQTGAYSDVAKNQINLFKQQLELYRLHVGTYPSTTQGLAALRAAPLDLPNPYKWKGPYAADEIPLDPWDNEYRYELLDPTQYRIWSVGPDLTDGTEDDISNIRM